jgi:DNA (cytosine-5)-methyltransferase 1
MNVHQSLVSQELTVTDLFCGAGGSSIGAEAGGARLRMAANHWKLAVETHASNFPNADHDCADISQVDPRRYPRTDILLASPECTTHSQANSTKRHNPDLFNPAGDPATERSRATMWDVPRFVEHHRYQAIVVENVFEVTKWPPFEAWLQAMHSFGYSHKVVSLNSMVAWPTPQSRDRLYMVFWRTANKAPDLDIRPKSYCLRCAEVVEGIQSFKNGRGAGKYRSQYVYRCGSCGQPVQPLVHVAAEAIDWTIPAPRIGDRDKPLADATRRRIALGLERFGPSVIQNAGHCFERNRDSADGYIRAWPAFGQPIPAQTATLEHGIAMPFVAELRGGGSLEKVRDVTEPLATVCASGNHHGLVVPMHHLDDIERRCSTLAELMPTQTGRQEMGLALPWMPVQAGSHPDHMIVKHYGDPEDRSMQKLVDREPLGSVTGVDSQSLVAMPFLSTYNGNGSCSPVDRPVPTQTSVDTHGLVEPRWDVDDCGFRMLEPQEIGKAMAFPESYKVKGTKRDRVRQYGNAVTPPAMSLLVQRVIDSLAAA